MSSLPFALAGLVVGLLLFGRPRRLGANGHGAASPPTGPLRIVIPARDEAASIGNLLADLGTQLDDDWEIVVVDDRSSDDTAAIACGFGFATVVTAPERPPSWAGKPWACHVGAQHPGPHRDAAELLFLDADVRLAPGAVRALVADRRRGGGVVSVQPFHAPGSAVEQLSAIFNLVSLMGIGAGSDRPRGMFGPVVACSRADHDAVGGFGSVRSSVIEDVALARVFRDAGVPVAVRIGRPDVSFRMYPLGLRSIVDGWTKNMALGAGAVPIWRSLGVAWWVTTIVSASAVPFTFWTSGSWSPAVVYVAVALMLAGLLRQVGSFRWWVPAAFPVVVAFFVLVFARSAWCTHVRRSVTWRGRSIDLREAG